MIRGMKDCSNDGGYMAKMAVMPVWASIFKKLLVWSLKSKMITIDFFTERSNTLPAKGLESRLTQA